MHQSKILDSLELDELEKVLFGLIIGIKNTPSKLHYLLLLIVCKTRLSLF
jgi:hypothetical protein